MIACHNCHRHCPERTKKCCLFQAAGVITGIATGRPGRPESIVPKSCVNAVILCNESPGGKRNVGFQQREGENNAGLEG